MNLGYVCITLMLSGVIFGGEEDLDGRVASLEERVTAVERFVDPSPCISRYDGMIFQDRTDSLEPKDDGSWAYMGSHIYGGRTFGNNYEFEVLKKFSAKDGKELLLVKLFISSPRDKGPRCERYVYAVKDVLLFE